MSSKDAAILTGKRYSSLLSDIKELVTTADTAASAEKVTGYWKVGRRITAEKLSTQAGYHNSILSDLAADSRMPLRNLQRAVLLTAAYPKGPPKPDGLTWTHYRILITVADTKERELFRKLAIEEQWTGGQLEAAVRRGLGDDGEPTTSLLERPSSPNYIYSAILAGIVDGDTLDLDIDLGFQTTRRQRVRLVGVDATDDRHSKLARAAKTFVTKRLLGALSITVKTERVDLHGRYLAHIFYSTKKMDVAECFRRGHYLNAQLIDEDLARLSL